MGYCKHLHLTILFSILFFSTSLGQNFVCTPSDANSTILNCTQEQSDQPTIDTGDTAWMLASTALVMFMTPGLAFFYSGLVRAKHSINTLLMCYIALGLVTVHWVLFGYTFAFGPGGPGFGNFDFVALNGVGQEPNPNYAATIPHILYMTYQMMFAIITPAIISGAVVERMAFRSYIIFILIWTTVVYDSIAHWIWSGWEHTNDDGTTEFRTGWLRNLGALDFAGGTVVHMASGFSALVACIVVGKRHDYDHAKPYTPHNVPFVLLGAAILWFGWFGFNGGSALGANGLASLALANTQIATGIAFLTWNVLDAIIKKKVTAVGAASGAVVGLVAITPCAGFINLASSLAVGSITVVVCYFTLEAKAKYLLLILLVNSFSISYIFDFNVIYLPRLFPQVDDSLDVFTCHGVGGLMGCLLTGFFANKNVNPAGSNGVFFGDGHLLGYQIVAILVTLGFSCGVTLVVLLYTIGLTVKEDKIAGGLDMFLHGNKAYYYDEEPAEAINRQGEIPINEETEEGSLHSTHSTRATPEVAKSETNSAAVEMGDVDSSGQPIN